MRKEDYIGEIKRIYKVRTLSQNRWRLTITFISLLFILMISLKFSGMITLHNIRGINDEKISHIINIRADEKQDVINLINSICSKTGEQNCKEKLHKALFTSTYYFSITDKAKLTNVKIYPKERMLINYSGFEIGGKGSSFKILDMSSNPLYKKVTIRIYNFSRYIVISHPVDQNDVKIEIKDDKGRRLILRKKWSTTHLYEDWENNRLWAREIKNYLRLKGLDTDLDSLFYTSTLPEGWMNDIFEICKDHNVERDVRYVDIKIRTKPSSLFKLYYFDPIYFGWQYDNWEYRDIYYLNNTNNMSLDGYAVLIKLNRTNFHWDKANPDLSDLRVTEFNETTQTEVLLPYWIEYVDRNNEIAWVWVKVQNLSRYGNITLFLYYDNPNALDAGDGDAVFLFFDGFNGTAIDTSKWTDIDGSYTIENGAFHGTGGDSVEYVISSSTFYRPFIVGLAMKATTTSSDFDSGVAIGAGADNAVYCTDDTPASGNYLYTAYDTWWTNGQGSSTEGAKTYYKRYRLTITNATLYWNDIKQNIQTVRSDAAVRDGALILVNDADGSNDVYFDYIYVAKYYENETLLTYFKTEYVGRLNVTITHPLNNKKVYRFESFYLNATLNVSGFSLPQYGNLILDKYYDFSDYEYKENITIRREITNDDGSIILSSNPPWYNLSFAYRQAINISNPNTNNLDDYQVNISLDTASLIAAGKMNTSCKDIRVTFVNKTTNEEELINYWIEKGCNTGSTVIWIKVPRLYAQDNTTIYVYYGNNQTQSLSNPDSVFDFYDNFDGTDLDGDKWVYNTGNYQVSNGYISMWGGWNGNNYYISSKTSFNFPFIVEAEGRLGVVGSDVDLQILIDSTQQTDSWNSNGVVANYDGESSSSTYYYQKDLQVGGSTIAYGPQIQSTNWQLLKIIYNSTGIEFWDNWSMSSLYYSGSLSFPQYVGIAADSDSTSRYGYLNWIRVRKYTQDENFVLYKGSSEESKESVAYYYRGVYKYLYDTKSYDTNFTNVSYEAITPPNTDIKVYMRTSADTITWSSWQEVNNNQYPALPKNRYLGVEIILNTTDNKTTPQFNKLNVSYDYVKNSPLGWAQYLSTYTPLKFLEDESYGDFNNNTGLTNISISVNGGIYLSPHSTESWYDARWKYRQAINISNPNTNNLDDYQVNITLDTASLIAAGKMNKSCKDIRVTFVNKTTNEEELINYWIEKGCNTASTVIWIKVPRLYAQDNTTIYVYYGNNQTQSLSNPDSVFDFYDNFDGTDLDGDKWVYNSPNYQVSNGYISMWGGWNGNNYYISSKTSFNFPFIVEAEGRLGVVGSDVDLQILIDSTQQTDSWSGNGVVANYDGEGTSNDYNQKDLQVGGSTIAYGPQIQSTNWQLLKIIYNSTGIEFWDNWSMSSLYYSGSLSFPQYVGIAADSDSTSRYGYLNWIRVRKYAKGIEEQYLGEEIYSAKPSGEYLSKVFDIGSGEYVFDKFYWYGSLPSSTQASYYIRTSDDASTWTSWYAVSNDTLIEASPKRYVQYKVDLSTTDSSYSPYVDEIDIGYKVQTLAFTNMRSDTLLSTSNSFTCSHEDIGDDNKTCYMYWSVTPKQEGNYTLRIKSNSTNTFIEDAYSQEVNISVFIRTSIIDFTIQPSTQGQGRNITLRAKLTDDLGNPIAGYNITFCDSTQDIEYGKNLTDNNGYAELTYTVLDILSLGYHTVYAKFDGDVTKFLEKSNTSITYKVSSIPQINSLEAIPSWQGDNSIVTLRANVTDKVGINNVKVHIFDSNNEEVSKEYMTHTTGDLYEYNFTSWVADKYRFYVVANNTDGISNESWNEYFTIDIRAEMGIATTEEEYQNYEDVLMDVYDADDWWNTSWKYRRKIKLTNPNDVDVYYNAINLTINTSQLISEGKLNSDCSDLRFISGGHTYMVELNLTNPYSYDLINYTTKITITQDNILKYLKNDGSNIRIFEFPVNRPYKNNTYLDYWVENVDKEAGNAIIWVKIPKLEASSTRTYYMYYGNKNAVDVQDYDNVFDEIIGEAGTYTLTSGDSYIYFLSTYSEAPVVISSLNSENEGDQAFVRVKDVNSSTFQVAIQESVSLDSIHGSEDASYIALLPGKWIVAGKYLEVAKVLISNPDGGTYNTINFQNIFSTSPIVLSQVLSFNESDPVKTRENNIDTQSVNIKLEETSTSDTAHGEELVGYVAIPPITMSFDGGAMSVGERYINQPDSSSWTYFSLSSIFAGENIVVVGKLISENGGDNSHERIANVTSSGFNYQVEEEAGYDGAHIYEYNGYIAVTSDILIHAIPYTFTYPSSSFGTPVLIDTQYEKNPYWIERGCGENTTIWVQVPNIEAGGYAYIHMYYGNSNAKSESNEDDVFSYPVYKSLYYVLDGDIAADSLYVAAYNGGNIMSGSTTLTLDKQDTSTIPPSDLTLGNPVKATVPFSSSDSSTANGDMLTPQIARGTVFIHAAPRGVEYLTIKAFEDDTYVEVYDGSTGFTNVTSFTLSAGQYYTYSYDFANGHSILVNSTKPILLHRRAETNEDFFTVFPAGKEWYGVPSNYLYIAALEDNTNIYIYRSDQSSSTYINLNAGNTYVLSGLGSSGSAPAIYIKADKPIHALAYADGDGTEATTFYPKEELDREFIIPEGSQYVAIATKDAVATCYRYDSSGALLNTYSTSYASSSSPYPGKILTGAVNAGDLINCTSPAFMYFETDGNTETNILGPKGYRYKFYKDIEQEILPEEDGWANLRNMGNTSLKGYLYMIVEKKVGSSWSLVFPDGVRLNDKSAGNLRVLLPGESINLTDLWNSNPWNTADNDPGLYRIHAQFVDDDMAVIYDSYGFPLEDIAEFEIIKAVVELSNLTHENKYEHGVKEYEVGDNIKWINLTVNAINNTAINAKATLTLEKPDQTYAGFGPNNEEKLCGNIPAGSSCTLQYNNNSEGYNVSLSLPGVYKFYWDVVMTLDNGDTKYNGSEYIVVHDLRENFSSTLQPIRIYKGKDDFAYYNFTIYNQWSKNISYVNVTINCNSTLQCNCSLPGHENEKGYCYIGNISAYSYAYANFTIEDTPSTKQDDYTISANISYVNPGNEVKRWDDLQPQTLEVRNQGILAVTVYEYPTTVIRNDGEYNISAFINNTALDSATNAWLNYTLPTNWYNTSGKLEDKANTLPTGNIFWNNISVNLSLGASTGPQIVHLQSASDQGQEDFKDITVYVYANTKVLEISFSDENVSNGETVTIYAKLYYDNGTAIGGESLSFEDINESLNIGNAITDSSGIAQIQYTIPDNPVIGLHLINVSFGGDSYIYVLQSYNYSWLDVGLKPFINSLDAIPQYLSYENNVSITANVSDDDGIASVTLYVSYPNGTHLSYNMVNIYNSSGDIYQYNLTNLWLYGTYGYYIVVKDITGSINQSSTQKFYLHAYSSANVEVERKEYAPNQIVYLNYTRESREWAYPTKRYKRLINVTNNYGFDINDSYVVIDINSTQLQNENKLDSNCMAISFSYYNKSSGKEERVKFYVDNSSCGGDHLYAYVYIPYLPASSYAYIYIYYDKYAAANDPLYSEEEVFSYDTNKTTFYIISSIYAGSNINVVAFRDGTSVSDGTTNLYLNKGDTGSLPSADLSQITGINHDKPIYGAGANTETDSLAPLAFAGRRFTYRLDRGTNEFHMYAPFADASCTIYDGTTSVDTFTLTKGTASTRSDDITDGNAVIIECNNPVIVIHDGSTGSNDAYIFYPATTEWWGVASNYLLISALEDGTTVKIYKSDGSTNTININRGGTYRETGLGSQGAGPAIHVVADKPIGVSQLADGDGTEATTYLPTWELDKEYYLPESADYLAIALPYSFTKCDLYDTSNTLVETHTIGSLSTNIPGHMLFGSAGAGYHLICNNSVFVYYEQTAHGRETNLLGMKSNRLSYGYNNSNINITNIEEEQKSVIINYWDKNMSLYLEAKVEKNTTTGWQLVEKVIDDLSNNHVRIIPALDSLDIADIWNDTGWDTAYNSPGEYRIHIQGLNKEGNLLYTEYGYIEASDNFTITSGELKLNITSIKIYNVTDSLNPHLSTLDLKADSINDTFIMYANEIYRIEVRVNVTPDSAIWWINKTNVTYSNLNSLWIIKTNDIWYKNSTDTAERNGGNFSLGVVKWNTTGLNGKENAGGYVTFYFVLNLTGASPEKKQVHFEVKGENSYVDDYSVFDIRSQDSRPPHLYKNTYGLDKEYVIRGDSVLAYARWDEEIKDALIEYNSTTSTLLNYTITLPTPNPQNWTNYTITTSSLWLLGNHTVKIYAEDVAENWNYTLPYLILPVYGLARITEGYINDTTPDINGEVKIICKVEDISADPDVPIENYIVYFYNGTQLLGTNLTNSSGYAVWIYKDLSPGEETLTCNITTNHTRFYMTDSYNEKTFTIYTYEHEPPTYYYVSQSMNIAHKGDNIVLSTLWRDNFQLDYAILAVNTSGAFENTSTLYLNHNSEVWANFTYSIPTTISPTYIAWYQYANDTSSNYNKTNSLVFDVWGWSKIVEASLNPSSMFVGNSTIIKCRVGDANDTYTYLSSYAVYFYNSTQLLGVNNTDANGYATWNYTDYSPGQEYIVCNITDNATLKYNASSENSASMLLNTVQGADATPPHLVNNVYGINVTTADRVFRDESILLHGWWDEAINQSWYEITTTSSSVHNTYYFPPPYPDNWTNTTINLDYSWYLGSHNVKLYVNDSAGNVNNTLDYLYFNVWGLSKVQWIYPHDGQEVNRSTIYLITNVTDYDTSVCIPNYKVDYYDNETTPIYYIGSAYTDQNNNCYANFSWDASSTSVGWHRITAQILDDGDKYYQAQSDYDAINIIIVIFGALNTTIRSPIDGQKVYRGQVYWFDSTTLDDTGTPMTPEHAYWYDNGNLFADGENINRQIPIDATLGQHKIDLNTTSPYYERGHDEIYLDYWSKADVNNTYPYNGSSYYQDDSVIIQCNVSDYVNYEGIYVYPVDFYIYNATDIWYLGSSSTNTSGIAVKEWYINSSEFKKGYYTVKCNITAQPSFKYDVNSSSSTNILYVNETQGYLVVNITHPPAGKTTYVGKNANFTINATVKCLGGNCGEVNATALYDGTPISTVIGTQPFYITDGNLNPRECGILNLGDECNVSFVVNATGDFGSIWNITVKFTSPLTADNETDVAFVYIGYVLILEVTPSNISTWYQSPPDPSNNYPATSTSNLEPSTQDNKAGETINVKLSIDSATANGGLWIKGENMTSYPYNGYEIPVWNITRCIGKIEDFPSPSSASLCLSNPNNNLRYNYTKILDTMYPGDDINITLFIDVPPVYADKYNGTVWFMVNGSY